MEVGACAVSGAGISFVPLQGRPIPLTWALNPALFRRQRYDTHRKFDRKGVPQAGAFGELARQETILRTSTTSSNARVSTPRCYCASRRPCITTSSSTTATLSKKRHRTEQHGPNPEKRAGKTIPNVNKIHVCVNIPRHAAFGRFPAAD